MEIGVLVCSGVPGDSDHQVDGEFDGDDIGHHRCLTPKRSQQAFAGSSDKTCDSHIT